MEQRAGIPPAARSGSRLKHAGKISGSGGRIRPERLWNLRNRCLSRRHRGGLRGFGWLPRDGVEELRKSARGSCSRRLWWCGHFRLRLLRRSVQRLQQLRKLTRLRGRGRCWRRRENSLLHHDLGKYICYVGRSFGSDVGRSMSRDGRSRRASVAMREPGSVMPGRSP